MLVHTVIIAVTEQIHQPFPDRTKPHAVPEEPSDIKKGSDALSSVRNPLLPGFHPDPSICRRGGDFYIVNSTFAYFPGLSIFHTRDFKHLRQLGNALTEDTQLPLEGVGHSHGLYAPTIRCHDGVFYLVCTNLTRGGNFIVTAENPEGPWSEPHWIEGADGIDPSLFFDEDGACYYTGTRSNSDGERYPGDGEIYIARLDLTTFSLCGQPVRIWKGALNDCVWPEGPHLYRKDGRYYLMIAEGGTGEDHAVTIARSDAVFGPYTGCPRNPILTHRHLGRDYPVKNVGHADMVQDENGSWYMVMLASRPCEGGSNLGRETFFARVEWEDGWPVVNPGVGRLKTQTETPLPDYPMQPRTARLSFSDMSWPSLDPRLMFLRNPQRENYAFCSEGLRLSLSPVTLMDQASASFICMRQTSFDYMAETRLAFSPAQDGEVAGLALVQSDRFHIRLEYGKERGQAVLRAVVCEDGAERIIARLVMCSPRLRLRMVQHGQMLSLSYRAHEEESQCEAPFHSLCDEISTRRMCTEEAGGFVGCTVGVYASANGRRSDAQVLFDYLEYRDL